MDGFHLTEAELALAADGEGGAETLDHLRWCRRCRSRVNGYRWLQEEIAAALVAVAEVVSVPRPGWGAVQARVRAGRQRLAAARRLSAIASVALVACVMLLVSSVAGTGIATYALPPAAVPAPLAEAGGGPEGMHAAVVTPTSILVCEAACQPLAPTPIPHPAPGGP
jgi:hypothetical protein